MTGEYSASGTRICPEAAAPLAPTIDSNGDDNDLPAPSIREGVVMLNLAKTNALTTTADAPVEAPPGRWRMMLAALLREHALSHRAAANAALHRRAVASLRKEYLQAQRRAHEASRPQRAAATSDRGYFAPSRHSFGR